MLAELPQALTNYLADAEVEVLSWSAQTQELVLKISKEIGAEQGLLRFSDVSRVDLPSRFTIDGITVSSPISDGCTLEPTETVFHIHEAWGEHYSVVAEALTYDVVV